MAAIDEVLSAKCFDTLQIQQPAHQTSEIMQIPQRRLSDKWFEQCYFIILEHRELYFATLLK